MERANLDSQEAHFESWFDLFRQRAAAIEGGTLKGDASDHQFELEHARMVERLRLDNLNFEHLVFQWARRWSKLRSGSSDVLGLPESLLRLRELAGSDTDERHRNIRLAIQKLIEGKVSPVSPGGELDTSGELLQHIGRLLRDEALAQAVKVDLCMHILGDRLTPPQVVLPGSSLKSSMGMDFDQSPDAKFTGIAGSQGKPSATVFDVSCAVPGTVERTSTISDADPLPSLSKADGGGTKQAPAGSWVWRCPDPSLPAPRGGGWEKNPDGVSQAEVVGGACRFVSASVRGRGHKQDGLFCDDSGGFLQVGPWKLLIASDGAGNSKFSRIGSQLATEAVKSYMATALAALDPIAIEIDDTERTEVEAKASESVHLQGVLRAFQGAFASAAEKINARVQQLNQVEGGITPERHYIDEFARGSSSEARRRTRDLDVSGPVSLIESDFHCTLLVCALTKIVGRRADGSSRPVSVVISCAIGDGMMTVFRQIRAKEPAVIMLMAPDAGQYAGQTQFLTTASAAPDSIASRLCLRYVGKEEDVVAIAVMTDGVADDYYEGEQDMERLYCDLLVNGLLDCGDGADDYLAEPESDKLAMKFLTIEDIPNPSLHGDAKEFPVNLNSPDLDADSPGVRVRSASDGPDFAGVLVRPHPIFGPPRLEGMQPQFFPVKYSADYLTLLGLTARELLNRPTLLRAIARQEPAMAYVRSYPEMPSSDANEAACQAADQLRSWMDVYIVKGSFDDRTLVLLETGVPFGMKSPR